MSLGRVADSRIFPVVDTLLRNGLVGSVAGLLIGEMRARDAREGSSCDGQDLVADKVEANPLGEGPVEEERSRRFKHVLTQMLPCIAVSEDVFGKALGAIATVGLLDDLEHQFRHTPL